MEQLLKETKGVGATFVDMEETFDIKGLFVVHKQYKEYTTNFKSELYTINEVYNSKWLGLDLSQNDGVVK